MSAGRPAWSRALPRPAFRVGAGLALVLLALLTIRSHAPVRAWSAEAVPSRDAALGTTTHLAYRLPTPGTVRLDIYDTGGRLLRTVTDQVRATGLFQVCWDGLDQQGSPMAGGVYIARLHHPAGVQMRRVLYMR